MHHTTKKSTQKTKTALAFSGQGRAFHSPADTLGSPWCSFAFVQLLPGRKDPRLFVLS
jgi:hypothetical protein